MSLLRAGTRGCTEHVCVALSACKVVCFILAAVFAMILQFSIQVLIFPFSLKEMNPLSTRSLGSSLWVLDDLLLVTQLVSPEVFVEGVHRHR